MKIIKASSFATVLATVAGVGLVATPSIVETPTRLVWNVSGSAPIGLYVVQRDDALAVDDWVLVEPPTRIRAWLEERRYLAANVPLVKRVAALSGQAVCLVGRLIIIDGVAMAPAGTHDRYGLPLPIWEGCKSLLDTQIFLMTWDEPNSLDGRYFGPMVRLAVIGRLTPVWTVEAP